MSHRDEDQTNLVGEQVVDLGKHVVVKSIDFVFNNKGIKVAKKLEVLVKDGEEWAEWKTMDSPERTDPSHWDFKDSLFLFPDNSLTIRPLHSRWSRVHAKLGRDRDPIDSYTILAKDIISFFDSQPEGSPLLVDGLEYPGPKSGKNGTITLKVYLRGFDEALVEVDTTSLNPNAEAEIVESLSSSDSLHDCASELRSVFEKIGENSEVVERVVGVLENVASAHPITKVAISALLIPYKLLKVEHEFKNDMRRLAIGIKFLLELLADARWIAKIASTKHVVRKIMKAVIDVSHYIHEFVNKSHIKQLVVTQIRSKLDEHLEIFKNLRQDFSLALLVQIAGRDEEMAGDVKGLVQIGDELRIRELLSDRLAPAAQQPLGSRCLEETRVKILAHVDDWLKDTTKPNMLWISGAPGAGKSTISTTIVEKHNCARFFVKRSGTEELRNPRAIWRTIASALARMHHGVRDDIVKVLSENEEYHKDAKVRDQFQHLIDAPLRKHAATPSESAGSPFAVIVIDALDECLTTNDDDWKDLLRTLADWRSLPANVKLLVTSRNETDIRHCLRAVSECIVLETGNDISNETSNDIRLLFETGFQGMQGLPDPSWPGKDKINDLTKHAAGLFIWAKTVIKFVAYRGTAVPSRLAEVTDNMGSVDVARSIDDLYGQVIYTTFSAIRPKEQDVAKFVLAAISMAKAPIKIQDLVEFLAYEDGGKKDDVRFVIEVLSPIINVRESDELLQVCHKTLSDFLLDESRAQEVVKQLLKPSDDVFRYTIRRSEQCARLVEACLRLMNDRLTFNICHIPTSHCFNYAPPIRKALAANPIPSHLLYACRYWAEHLNALDGSTHKPDDILDHLKDFLETHILHWLEVLSLTNSADRAPYLLSRVERYTEKWGKSVKIYDDKPETLSDLARDAHRFSTTFQQPIADSAPHIYISALPFSPSKSMMAQIYGPRHSTLSVITGRRQDWDNVVMKTDGDSYNEISCFAYFPNGEQIASGERWGVCIWDAYSGKAVGDVMEHGWPVTALSISPDGSQIVASGSLNDSVRVWDVKERRCIIGVKVVQKYKNFPIALSRDGAKCAFVSNHGAVHIQEVKEVGELRSCVRQRTQYHVESLVFSHDGSLLVSCSRDGRMIIWNTRNGEIHGETLMTEGEARFAFHCLAISADGEFIASSCSDGTLQLWDRCMRKPARKLMRGHGEGGVFCVAFSGDSKAIVAGFGDGSICFWSTETQELIGGSHRGLFNAGTPWKRSILSFSPDGLRLAFCDRQNIQVWDAKTIMHHVVEDDYNVSGYYSHVCCIAFDGKRFASGSADGAVRIWDACSGLMSAEWTGKKSRDGIVCLEFIRESASGSVVFCSREGWVREWCPGTGQLRREVLMDDLPEQFKYLPTIPAISPDGRHIALPIPGPTVLLLDCATGKEVERFDTYDDMHGDTEVMITVFSCGGELIASGSEGGTIRVWRVDSEVGEQPSIAVFKVHPHEIGSIRFSPDAKRLACTYGEFLGVWDMKTCSSLFQMTVDSFNSTTCRVSFSPHGDVIASASPGPDRTLAVQFWNGTTGESIGQINRQGGWDRALLAVEYSSDGKLVYSADSVGALRMWELNGGLTPITREIQTLDTTKVIRVSFHSSTANIKVLPQRELGNSASANSTSISHQPPAFFDGMGEPAIGDWSYMEENIWSEDVWMRNRSVSGGDPDDDPILFWVPPANRPRFWWPRNITFMDASEEEPVTRIDFSYFMHGENWDRCREPRPQETRSDT